MDSREITMRNLPLIAAALYLLWAGTCSGAVTGDMAEDALQPHVTLIVHDDYQSRPAEMGLVAQFRTEAQDASVRWHQYSESSPIYQTRLANRVEVIPAVICQRYDGMVDPAVDVAADAEACATLFNNRPWRRLIPARRPHGPKNPCPDGNCPAPDESDSAPPIIDYTIVPEAPKIEPEPEPVASKSLWVLGLVMAIACGMAGGIIPVARHFRN
jgi:hypothetical protein